MNLFISLVNCGLPLLRAPQFLIHFESEFPAESLNREKEIWPEEEAIFCGADGGGGEASRYGRSGDGADRAGGHFRADVRPLEEAVYGPAGGPGTPTETVAGRERSAEAGGGRPDAGQGHAAGRAVKKIVTPSRRRPVVGYLCGGYGVSERRACKVARLARSTRRYGSQKDPQTALRFRIREIAQARVRYGYRKIRVLLNREGWKVGKKRVYRLYREEGLTLRQRPRRRRPYRAAHDYARRQLRRPGHGRFS